MKLSSKQLKALIESEIKKNLSEVIEKNFKEEIAGAVATAILVTLDDMTSYELSSNSFEILMGSTMQYKDEEKYEALAELSDSPVARDATVKSILAIIAKDLEPKIVKCLSDLVDSTVGTLEDDVL